MNDTNKKKNPTKQTPVKTPARIRLQTRTKKPTKIRTLTRTRILKKKLQRKRKPASLLKNTAMAWQPTSAR